MKIIKRVDTSTWSYKYTCTQCESELEVEKQDLIHRHYDGDMREPSSDYFEFECPVCRQQSSINHDKIPKALQVEIKNKK